MQAHGLDPTLWLAQTKLRPPLPRPDSVPRPQLLNALGRALLSSRLTLVSAPAGFGKTTLLSALPAALPDPPLGWVSLDEDDGDPARFLMAICFALRRIWPQFGITTLSLLGGPPKPGLEPRHVVGALVNDLLESAPQGCILVLDDLHAVTAPAVHVTLDYFLERMPPQVHVAIATRHDPPVSLARLRARGQLAEFRLSDVRFSFEEAAELLNGRFRLALGPDDLGRIYTRTEGWPAGLQLLGSSLGRIASPAERSAFVADLMQTDRHVFDFLAAEVLDRQDPSVRSFLLETSILPELTPELCRTVTERDDAAEMLAEIDRRGLFVVAGGGTGGALRYHTLFAEFLRGRLKQEKPDRIADLHGRAGRAAAAPGMAIPHYLAAERWQDAASVIEQAAGPMLADGLAGTVASWIQSLPPDSLGDRPRLNLLYGISLLGLGNPASAVTHVEQALSGLEAASDQASAGTARSFLATCRFLQGDLDGASAMVERALGHDVSVADRVQLLMTRCWLTLLRGDCDQATANLNAAAALVEGSKLPHLLIVMGLLLKPNLALLPGGIGVIERFIDLVSPHVGDHVTPLSAAVEELAAAVHFYRGRLDQTLASCERVVAAVERLGGYPFVGPPAAGLGAHVCVARGDFATAERYLALARSWLPATPLTASFAAVILYVWGKLRLLQGDLAAVREAVLHILPRERAPLGDNAAVLRLKLDGELAMVERRFSAAERALREAAALERQFPMARMTGSVGVLLARLAYERNHLDAALAELAPLLEECEREGHYGLILVDGQEAAPVLRLAARRGVHSLFAERLLSILEPTAPRASVTVPETGEVLSAREMEILALVTSGASNHDIAERLVIGETTVKTHVSNIMRKLNVSSRTEAAARARVLQQSAE